MRFPLIFSLIMVITFAQKANGQSPYPVVYNKNHGLQSNSIYDIHQDAKGYIWLATGHGLCRFNGKDFTHYKSIDQTMKSGSCIKEDRFGRIWYSNFDGFLYYVENDKLKAFPQKTNTGFMNFGITKDFVYLPSYDKVQIYDLNTFKLITEAKLDKQIHYTYQDNETFLVLTDVLSEITELKVVKKYVLPFDNNEDFIAPMIVKFNESLGFFSKFSKKFYLLYNGVFISDSIKSDVNFIQNISKDDDNIWLNTPNGVNKIDPSDNSLTNYFKDVNISCIFKDKNNQYWLGTQNQGLYFVSNFDSNFDTNFQNATRLISDGKNKFLGTFNDQIFLNSQLIFESNANHAVNFMLHDTLNKRLVWASSKLYFYDLPKQRKENEIIIAVKDLIQLDKKYYAYSASGSIGFLVANANEKSDWDNFVSSKDLVKDKRIVLKAGLNGKTVAKSGKKIYFGTNQGLFSYEKDQLIELFENKNKVYLTHLKAHHTRCYGLGTNDLLYFIEGNKVYLWDEANKLLGNNTQKIFLRQDFAYLYDGKNLFEYNLLTHLFDKIFASTDAEVRDVAFEKYKIDIVTNRGIITLLRKSKNQNYLPLFKLKSITVDGKVYQNNRPNSFNADSKVVNINYDYINFLPENDHIIEYKINDGVWIETNSTNNSIQLLSLGSDDYSIQIKVKGYDSTLNKIKFVIENPWYLRWYAYLFYGVILFLLIYQLQKNQTKKLNEKNLQALEKLELEKNMNLSTLKAIKSQMNPHFFFNALNTIQAFILSNDKKQAINYLSKFSSLTRSILEMTEKDFISLTDEIKILNNYLDIEHARFHEDFDFEIKCIEINDPDQLKIPTMIIQPFIENAIKHGLLHKEGAKLLKITFENKGSFLRLTIEDNGIGRQKSGELNAIKNKHHQSFATQAIENRIELINKNNPIKISIRTEDKYNSLDQSLGTVVYIDFPFY